MDKQRAVVTNERRQRYDNQPYGDWDERLQALVYPADHPYRHPVIGSMEDIDAATAERWGLVNQVAPPGEALTEARRLAAWVGESRRVTPQGFLRPPDVPAAAAAGAEGN